MDHEIYITLDKFATLTLFAYVKYVDLEARNRSRTCQYEKRITFIEY